MKEQTVHVVAEEGRDERFKIASDIETVVGKIDSLAGLLYELTDDTNQTYFCLLHHAEFIRAELQGVCSRAYEMARQKGAVQP
jgi:hypothetical protein